MANHNDFKTTLAHAFDLHMHLSHKRTGRIKNMQIPSLRLRTNRQRHAMRRENHRTSVWCFVQLLNEYRTFVFKIIDHIFIVYDFMPYINRRTKLLQSTFNNTDRTINAGTESARLRQDDGSLLLY